MISNIGNHIPNIPKLRAKIVTVDTSQRIIEAVTPDGGVKRIALFDIPTSFVWPKENETWSIYRENNDWVIGKKFLNEEESKAFQTSLPGSSNLDHFVPGDLKLSANSLQFGWLRANGAFVKQADYSQIYQKIGHSQNNGIDPEDGTFKLPFASAPTGLYWLVKT